MQLGLSLEALQLSMLTRLASNSLPASASQVLGLKYVTVSFCLLFLEEPLAPFFLSIIKQACTQLICWGVWGGNTSITNRKMDLLLCKKNSDKT